MLALCFLKMQFVKRVLEVLLHTFLLLFRRGSIIAELTVQYKHVNRDQVISFIAKMKSTKKLNNMSVSEVSVKSPSSKYHN